MKELLSILVLSCDNYHDIWDNFFDLKEKYWPDCPFQTYLVTESYNYHREGVTIIHAAEGNWSTRYRYAVSQIQTPYICPFLEDFFISDTIETSKIMEILQFVVKNKVDFINMDDGFCNILKRPNLQIVDQFYAIIPKHLPYGVDTAASIWNKEYLLKTLGEEDYSAWQFELDRCLEAKTTEGIAGNIYLDLRQTLNVSKIPVVIQGKYYPLALKFFKKKGFNINVGNRLIMTNFECIVYYMKRKGAGLKFGKKPLKYMAHKLFGMNFVSKD